MYMHTHYCSPLFESTVGLLKGWGSTFSQELHHTRATTHLSEWSMSTLLQLLQRAITGQKV